jgi:aryl-alcohol dehydrogenase-like predicted oxidoreductase
VREQGIAVTAYGILSRGLLAGSLPAATGDFRARLPRFSGENLARNRQLVTTVESLAADKGIKPAQLAIAWVLAKGTEIIPVIGARTRTQLADALGAVDVTLSPSEVARIEEAVPASAIAGDRYDAHQMRALDSER